MTTTQRNYDTTNGKPYVDFELASVAIDKATGALVLGYREYEAITDKDGVRRKLAGVEAQQTLVVDRDKLSETVPVIDLLTGAERGGSVSGYALLGAIASFVRAHQRGLDEAAEEAKKPEAA